MKKLDVGHVDSAANVISVDGCLGLDDSHRRRIVDEGYLALSTRSNNKDTVVRFWRNLFRDE